MLSILCDPMHWMKKALMDIIEQDSCSECGKTDDLHLCPEVNGVTVFCREHHVAFHASQGTTPEEDMKDDSTFDASLAQNGQITLKKSVRDALGIEPSDIIILRVERVISSLGHVKWDKH